MSAPEKDPVTRQRSRTQAVDEERADGRGAASGEPPVNGSSEKPTNTLTNEGKKMAIVFWERFIGKGRKQVGWVQSFINIARSSPLNVLLILIPFAWASHFQKDWPHVLTFVLSFLSMIPLEQLFEYGGDQMAFYCGKDLGDLITVTLNNAVEATLAIILLTKCELKLLQSTVVGVVILHLLLIPGTAFITGGARIWQQNLHPHLTQLNQTLLTIGVMALLLPAAFFAALDRGTEAGLQVGVNGAAPLVSDITRAKFLQMSRGLAIMLLLVYICSRIFLHNPPGEDNALGLSQHEDAPEEMKERELHYASADPEVKVWACLLMLAVTIGIMAATAEWLVDSIEFIKNKGTIEEEWFGLVLLPFVSYSADGAVAIIFFIRYVLRLFFGTPPPPATLAKAKAIDLSIQFTLFWMPFLVLLGWWTNKPMTLLFDFFEVALLLGACFLVNYVTADAKTNWAEGYVMVSFYFMIALCAWFYPGQTEIHEMLSCPSSIAEALASASASAGSSGGGAEGH